MALGTVYYNEVPICPIFYLLKGGYRHWVIQDVCMQPSFSIFAAFWIASIPFPPPLQSSLKIEVLASDILEAHGEYSSSGMEWGGYYCEGSKNAKPSRKPGIEVGDLHPEP